ncbi:serine/threonine-protein phosphatase 4 regulatory subunit 2 isoform X1 [Stomoxys calcitrans]|uniref:serine/threonine-protein phosphatase 4 regulatory subunit 2 isoform X1 n=1 Tax=Stomoxys calcitrans TaxID=35570 RepID=UPI0027E2B646|nr:serine/threonine-protein phosphatase 4 regulatory subunit 2 isoform X1 [Stomoxys calcitrans]
MVTMENHEEIMQILDRFTRLKQKDIPKELDDYLGYVAKTGDTVFKWASLKYLFREKLLNVIKNFYDTTPRIDEIPQYPNVDPFNYESMKSSLLERLELFNAAPFTIQRLCELLIDPRKQYSRIDKFMRALEKNILVVSTVEPGRKRTESENGDSLDSVVNGDLSLDVNVDIEMESEGLFNSSETTNGNGTATKAEVEAAKEETKQEGGEKSVSKNTHANDDDNLPNPKKAKLDLPDDSKNIDEEVKKSETMTKEQVEAKKMECEEVVEKSKEEKDGDIPNEEVKVIDEAKTATAENDDRPKMMKIDKESNETLEDKVGQNKTEIESKKEEEENEVQRTEEHKLEKPTEDSINKEEVDDQPDEKVRSPETEKTKSEDINEKPVDIKAEEEVDAKAVELKEASQKNENKDQVDNKEEKTVVEKQETEKREKDQVETNTTEVLQAEKDAEVKPEKPGESKEIEEADTANKDEPKEEDTKKSDAEGNEKIENVLAAENKTESLEEKATEKEGIEAEKKTELSSEIEKVAEQNDVAEKEATSNIVCDQVATNDPTEETANTTPAPTIKPVQVVETADETANASNVGVSIPKAPPTLALNDQPMEEDAATVQEVVMTDALAKPDEDPSGMEVDDTSQEAMDQ